MVSLHSFIDVLEKEGELHHIHTEVDPTYEIAEIHRRTIAENGKTLFFHRVKNSKFPVVTNLFGSEKRIALAFGKDPERFVQDIVSLIRAPFPPSLKTLWQKRSTLRRFFNLGLKKRARAKVTECSIDPVDLEQLPFLKLWPEDGGHFITLPLVFTTSPDKTSQNLGMYRIQRFDKNTTGLHFQIAKGGGYHLYQAKEQNLTLPVSIFVGGPPALILSAIAPLPENVPELIFASLVQGKKLAISQEGKHTLIAHAEFALLGDCNPEERRLEGPFGDHFGYYSLAHDFPVFHCRKLYHRKNAIWPATVVGKPIQEDMFIGNYLQKLFNPIFPLVMPQVKALHTFGETGFHPLCAAQVHERYEKESLAASFRILGEGQLALTKCLFVTNESIDITNIRTLLKTILCRFCPRTGLFVFGSTSNDTLDYTGPKLNHGSKMILLGCGSDKRPLFDTFTGTLVRGITKAEVFTSGVLVIEGDADFDALCSHEDFQKWPLIILTDDAKATCSSDLEFLWRVFTRFEPARDLYAKKCSIERNSISFDLPLVLDTRMKPFYPKVVAADDETKALVDKKWPQYCLS